MALLSKKERRLSARKQLTGLLPGRLKKPESGEDIDCKPVDVSQLGLGVVSEARLEQDEVLELVLKDERPVPLRVAWIRQDFAKEERWRYGMESVNTEISLEALFEEFGCLK